MFGAMPFNIIVAEDDHLTRLLHVTALKKKFKVVAVADKDAALRQHRMMPDAVIVSDNDMPNANDGISLIREIRNEPAGQGRDVPIVIVSAGDATRLRNKIAKLRGKNAFFPKPNFAPVLDHLQRLLTHQPEEHELNCVQHPERPPSPLDHVPQQCAIY